MKISDIDSVFVKRGLLCGSAVCITIFLVFVSLFEGIAFACTSFKDYMSELNTNIKREWSE